VARAKTDKARVGLRFKASVSLEEGLREYMGWFNINCVE
jgi:nucleoside-diphosphate-sugar epimerase